MPGYLSRLERLGQYRHAVGHHRGFLGGQHLRQLFFEQHRKLSHLFYGELVDDSRRRHRPSLRYRYRRPTDIDTMIDNGWLQRDGIHDQDLPASRCSTRRSQILRKAGTCSANVASGNTYIEPTWDPFDGSQGVVEAFAGVSPNPSTMFFENTNASASPFVTGSQPVDRGQRRWRSARPLRSPCLERLDCWRLPDDLSGGAQRRHIETPFRLCKRYSKTSVPENSRTREMYRRRAYTTRRWTGRSS